MKNYYQLLSIAPTATPEEIADIIKTRKAQCPRSKQYLAMLGEIEKILLTPDLRIQYDALLGYSTNTPLIIPDSEIIGPDKTSRAIFRTAPVMSTLQDESALPDAAHRIIPENQVYSELDAENGQPDSRIDTSTSNIPTAPTLSIPFTTPLAMTQITQDEAEEFLAGQNGMGTHVNAETGQSATKISPTFVEHEIEEDSSQGPTLPTSQTDGAGVQADSQEHTLPDQGKIDGPSCSEEEGRYLLDTISPPAEEITQPVKAVGPVAAISPAEEITQPVKTVGPASITSSPAEEITQPVKTVNQVAIIPSEGETNSDEDPLFSSPVAPSIDPRRKPQNINSEEVVIPDFEHTEKPIQAPKKNPIPMKNIKPTGVKNISPAFSENRDEPTKPVAYIETSQPVSRVSRSLELSNIVQEQSIVSAAPPVTGIPDWFCTTCGTQNPPKVRLCRKCGAIIGKPCPKCSALMFISGRSCPDCGVEIAVYEAALQAEMRKRQPSIIVQEPDKKNMGRIRELERHINSAKSELEDWEDAYAGASGNWSGEVERKYKRIVSSNPVPNLFWLWILLSIGTGIICGLVLRIPPDIALYIGLIGSFPAAIAVLRAGIGCYASLAVWAVGGSILAAVIAWGTQFMIGILCGLLALPIIYLLGKSIAELQQKEAIKTLIDNERIRTQALIENMQRELEALKQTSVR